MQEERFEFGNGTFSRLGKKEKENKYDFDFEKFNIDEQNDSHAAIARQIANGSTVLDIGCSTGTIGKILKKLKNCTVDGIEYDKNTALLAKQTEAYRNVYNFSITNPEAEDFQKFLKEKKQYDYVIFGDVLEHLYNPWDVLKNVANLLKRNGKIVVSLPNISHIDIIKGLINNKFNYNNVGLLDSTHIRFFSSTSFQDMIKNLADEENIYFNLNLVEKILMCPSYVNDSKIFELFNVDNHLENFLVLQNIFVLEKVNAKQDMKLEVRTDFIEYFDRMNEYYTAIVEDKERLEKEAEDLSDLIELEKSQKELLEKELIKLKKEIKKKNQEYIDLKKEFESLDKINQENVARYNEVVNSRRWKIINKIFQYSNKR